MPELGLCSSGASFTAPALVSALQLGCPYISQEPTGSRVLTGYKKKEEKKTPPVLSSLSFILVCLTMWWVGVEEESSAGHIRCCPWLFTLCLSLQLFLFSCSLRASLCSTPGATKCLGNPSSNLAVKAQMLQQLLPSPEQVAVAELSQAGVVQSLQCFQQ